MNKTVRLRIINAVEDLPQLITAHASVRGADFALAIKPHEGASLSLFHTQGRTLIEKGSLPISPTSPRDLDGALKTMSAFKKQPKGKGPMTYRGRWSGTLRVEDGAPYIELKRRVASYGTLFVTSDPESGWAWRTERSEKWFSKLGDSEGDASSLKDAVETGMASMMNLLGEACSFRDSRRRAAFDEPYAVKYPIKPAREGKDPLEGLERKVTRRSKSRAKPNRKAAAPRKPKAPVAPKPKQAATKPKVSATRAPIARAAALPGAPMPDTSGVDPAKDAALMAAFSDTLKSLLAGG